MEVKIKCNECGKEFTVPRTQRNRKYCSVACRKKARMAKPNVTCTFCGKEFHMKPYQLRSCKRNCGVFCSRECFSNYKRIWFAGENNHQYGLKGHLNSSFKGTEIPRKNNKNTDIKVYNPTHPFADTSGRVLKHRIIVEENAELFDDKYFVEINGKKYLKKGVDVHHKNMNHNDNSIENLEPVTRGEHTKAHNAYKEIVRGVDGRIVGIIKHEPVFVKIKSIKDDVVIPQKQHKHDAAFDVFVCDDVVIHKGRNVVPLGFAVEIPIGYAAFIRSRSGFSAKGMVGSDKQRHDADVITGLIDSPFRGEVGAIIKSEENFTISKGTRIAQMQFIEVPEIKLVEADELSETDRGTGGYGSSGN